MWTQVLQNEEYRGQVLSRTPMGRVGRIEEVSGKADTHLCNRAGGSPNLASSNSSYLTASHRCSRVSVQPCCLVCFRTDYCG
jgi:hypothetical protein